MTFLHTLTLTKNNTGQNQFSFYEQVQGGEVFLTSSVVNLNESLILSTDEIGDTFSIRTPNGNDDFDFTSSSLDV